MIDDFFETLFKELNKYLNEKDIKRLMFDENQFLNNLEPEKRVELYKIMESKSEEAFIRNWLQEYTAGDTIYLLGFPFLHLDSYEMNLKASTNIQTIVSVIRNRIANDKRRW